MVVRAMYSSNVQCFYFLLYFYHINIHHIFVFKIHIYFFFCMFSQLIYDFFSLYFKPLQCLVEGGLLQATKRDQNLELAVNPPSGHSVGPNPNLPLDRSHNPEVTVTMRIMFPVRLDPHFVSFSVKTLFDNVVVQFHGIFGEENLY